MYMTTLTSGQPAVGVKNGKLLVACKKQDHGLWPTKVLTDDGKEYTFAEAKSCDLIKCSFLFKKSIVDFLRLKDK